MAVFEIRHKKPASDKAAEQIAEEFDLIGAREIEDNRWLLAAKPEQIEMVFGQLRERLPRDMLAMREVSKGDLFDSGKLSDEEITRYLNEAVE